MSQFFVSGGISQIKILEWVAISFKDQTFVSCIGRLILYHWATREALKSGQAKEANEKKKKKITQGKCFDSCF